MKTCTRCNKLKQFDEFHKSVKHSSGYFCHCKECRKLYTIKYYQANKEDKKKKSMEYYKANKEKIAPKKMEYQKRMEREDVNFKLSRRLRNRLYYALQKKSWKKDTKFAQYIGCSLDELKAYLESKFLTGMTWDNYGKWHIDHIIPLASANTEEELFKLCHYTNLQPLWARDNIIKGAKVN